MPHSIQSFESSEVKDIQREGSAQSWQHRFTFLGIASETSLPPPFQLRKHFLKHRRGLLPGHYLLLVQYVCAEVNHLVHIHFRGERSVLVAESAVVIVSDTVCFGPEVLRLVHRHAAALAERSLFLHIHTCLLIY